MLIGGLIEILRVIIYDLCHTPISVELFLKKKKFLHRSSENFGKTQKMTFFKTSKKRENYENFPTMIILSINSYNVINL